MARIRSVHPGLFTDEVFVGLSDSAQMFWIGLLCEADDQGVFEWKPVTLRMRLRPAKDGDVETLLDELDDAGVIKPFEVDGRKYGAIRNFRKFQRPKSPNAIHPLPPDFRNYVCLTSPNGEIGRGEPPSKGETPPPEPVPIPQKVETAPADPPLIPRKGETAPQMEDGGGRREGVGKKESSADADSSPGGDPPLPVEDVKAAFDAYNATAQRLGLPIAKDLTDERRRKIRARLRASGGLSAWMDALRQIGESAFLTARTEKGFRADLDFVCQAKSFQRLVEGYYGEAKTRGTNGQANGAQAPPPEDEAMWAKFLRWGRLKKVWSRAEWGPAPNEPGCRAPPHLVEPGDGEGWAEFQGDER